jgi:hypothetical protein
MKSHRFDPISFFSGVIIIAIGLIFLLPVGPVEIAATFSNLSVWLWPIVFIAVGLAVLIPGLVPGKGAASSGSPDLKRPPQTPNSHEEE